jgi:hypothetical protein
MNPSLVIAGLIVGLEALTIWVLAGFGLVALITGDSTSITSSLFLTGMLAGAGLWVTNISLGLFRKKRWSHTAGMVLQLLAAAIGTASFSGEFGSAGIGFAILIPAALAFYLLFSKAVRVEFGKD